MQELKAKTNSKTIQWIRSRNCDNRKIEVLSLCVFPDFRYSPKYCAEIKVGMFPKLFLRVWSKKILGNRGYLHVYMYKE